MILAVEEGGLESQRIVFLLPESKLSPWATLSVWAMVETPKYIENLQYLVSPSIQKHGGQNATLSGNATSAIV